MTGGRYATALLVASLCLLQCSQADDAWNPDAMAPGSDAGGTETGVRPDAEGAQDAASSSVDDASIADARAAADTATDAPSVACGEQTAPDPFSKSIGGTWDFTPAGGTKMSIQVPGGGWVKQGINTSSGTYQTQITVPDSGTAQTTLIEFGAVNFQATLSVDGMMVGTNMTSFTPSVFDVTKFVTPGMQHTVSVLVKGRGALQGKGCNRSVDLFPAAAPWSPNVAQGIFRSAMLRVYPDVYISDVFVRPSVANDALTYDVSITNTGSSDQQVSLSGALGSWNCSSFGYPSIPATMVTAFAGKTTVATVGPIHWGLGPTSYWWPNVPYQAGYKAQLHNLKVDLSAGGQVKHEKVARFGFRETDQQRADAMHVYYYLNGVHVRFHGDNLQGADYDSIDNGGKGDAYDTLPGFLPPSANNSGWPGAIANYQKLNYNLIRVHQELPAPYMLDTADELGLMLIGETAIRGSNQNEDFAQSHDTMVNHAKAMVLAERNHPSIVRWSQSNEPEYGCNDSEMFEQDLFSAITALDPTRPVNVESGVSGNTYGITASNFAAFRHYVDGNSRYSENVSATPDYPYGQGEYIWPADNSAQGLAWFATSIMAMRRQDASDVRPYTLLSGWASVIPGVTRSSMSLEQGGPPLLGEDTVPDPWSNPLITRIQQASNPVLVADQAYWEANKMSDRNGTWPASIPALTKGTMSSRTLPVFNDTFSGTAVDVTWEARADSPTGAVASSGTLNLDVPLGSMVTQSINVTAPTSGSTCYLVLRGQKNGTTIFEETGEVFNLN